MEAELGGDENGFSHPRGILALEWKEFLMKYFAICFKNSDKSEEAFRILVELFSN